MLADFQNSSPADYEVNMTCTKTIPPQFKRVATLPYETIVFTN